MKTKYAAITEEDALIFDRRTSVALQISYAISDMKAYDEMLARVEAKKSE